MACSESCYIPLASPESSHIPLASLPRVAGTAGVFNNWLGSVGLLILLALDAQGSWKKREHWIEGHYFVVGGLALQFLENMYNPLVFFTNGQNLNAEIVEKLFKGIQDNQLHILSGRVAVCVFIGNMLPAVACRSPSKSDIVALSISAAGVLIHNSYEIYIIVINNMICNRGFQWDHQTLWFLVPNIIISCLIVLLVLFLICAVLASENIQDVVDHRIPVLLSPAASHESELASHESELVRSLANVEEQVVRSWITGRTYRPEYVIARSVLSSSIGFLVTVCVVVSIAASSKNIDITKRHGKYWSLFISVALQWFFILSGWAIVLWRWLTAVIYYPRCLDKEALRFHEYFRVEDFWKRATLDRQEELTYSRPRVLVRMLLSIFLGLQILLIFFSKICWLISEWVFSHRCTRRLLMGSTSEDEFFRLCVVGGPGNPSRSGMGTPGSTGNGRVESGSPIPPDFEKYSRLLMHMLGENHGAVWIANKNSINEMKAQVGKGESHAKKCQKLIEFLGGGTMGGMGSVDPFATSSGRRLQIERDLGIDKGSVKMRVVSLLTIVIELSTLYENGSSGTMQACIESCSQAWEIVEFIEILDQSALLVSKHASMLFQNLKKRPPRWLDLTFPINSPGVSCRGALEGLKDKGRKAVNNESIHGTGYDSQDWKAFIAGKSLLEVCENIENPSDNREEMFEKLKKSLINTILYCVIKVEIIMNECMSRAESFMDESERLSSALYIGGMAKGIVNLCRDAKGIVNLCNECST